MVKKFTISSLDAKTPLQRNVCQAFPVFFGERKDKKNMYGNFSFFYTTIDIYTIKFMQKKVQCCFQILDLVDL